MTTSPGCRRIADRHMVGDYATPGAWPLLEERARRRSPRLRWQLVLDEMLRAAAAVALMLALCALLVIAGRALQ